MVHVGVSSNATDITLEQCASNNQYILTDINGKVPENHCCHNDQSDKTIHSRFDIRKVCQRILELHSEMIPVMSNDAGR